MKEEERREPMTDKSYDAILTLVTLKIISKEVKVNKTLDDKLGSFSCMYSTY